MFAGKPLGRLAILIVMSTVVVPAYASDWPMWRFDSGRTAASPDALPQDLKLQWVRQLPEQQPAWPASQKKLQFDATYEPIVMGKKVYVGSTVSDSITAYNTETGAEEWRFTTGGPVRFAPVGKGDRIYVVSDDGFLYCLDAGSGALNWKFNGGPSDRTILGNDRLVSSWPARGGPVLVDDVIYFAAGIWPSMGVFIHALDARHGTVNWTNSSTGSQYVVHPHHAPSFGSISPQGYLAASGDSLIVPGGRSIPAVFDRANGELRYFDFGGSFARRRGGYAVSARDGYFFVDGGRLALETGDPLKTGRPQVISKEMVIELSLGYLDAETLKGTIKEEKKKNRKGEEVVEKKFEVEELWSIELPIDAPEDLFLMAGTDLYLGGEDMVARIDASDEGRVEDDEQELVWTAEVEGDVGSMIAADDKLFVATDESKLYCFGTTADEPITHELEPKQLAEKSDSASEQVASFLNTDGTSEGYTVVLGISDESLIDELLKQSNAHIIVVESNSRKVDKLRRRMDAAGQYGKRIAARIGDPKKFQLPAYLANLIVVDKSLAATARSDARFIKSIYRCLRPYGGVAFLPIPSTSQASLKKTVKSARLHKAVVSRSGDYANIVRAGALAGAGSWTHQYADAGNSSVSKDWRVKAPFGVLWFGGPSNDKILPRHGHGPAPQVVGGRLIIEGPDIIRAVDVYTGRVLWERDLKDVGKYYNITDHFSGAGETGSNYVSLADHIYVIYGTAILELDAATGKTNKKFELETEEGTDAPAWGYLTAWNDLLIATSSPVAVANMMSVEVPQDPEGTKPLFKPYAEWKYLAGFDPKDDWTAIDYDEEKWETGPAGFGFDDNDDMTVLADMEDEYSRVYIRKTFDREAIAGATEMSLVINYDDAFIAYLNGKEVERSKIEEGRGPDAKGIGKNGGYAYETFKIEDFESLLQPGNNVIAIEGHNEDLEDGDFTLDPYVLIKGEFSDDGSTPDETGPNVAESLVTVSHSSSSRRLHVFNRHTGQLLWSRDANYSFRHNCILVAAGKIFGIDGVSPKKLRVLKRRGVNFAGKARLMALDAFTGSEIWNTDEDIFGTFLSYSDRHDVLIQTGSYNRDRASDEVSKGMVAYHGVDGSVLWKNLELAYQGPCLMWRDKIITNGATGFKLDLFTGERTGWEFSRMYGCNAIIGSENLLTFRSGAAGFCDLAGDSGTGNLGGFKSSCTSNLIVADGVLNAPDYTRTCTCAYQNQTSLAFIHMPDEDQWTFNAGKRAEIDDRVGLNLGAPGDRRGPNGTLWLDMPKVGGPSPAGVYVEVKPEKVEWFSRHTSEMEDEGLKWVAASGGLGIETLTVKFGEEPKKEDDKKKDKKDEKPEKKEPPRPERPHRVTLHFAEPEHLEPGERVFTVSLQGEPVLEDFDIVEAAGGSNRAVVREFSGISVGSELVITLTPTGKSKKRLPILCGVELVANGK